MKKFLLCLLVVVLACTLVLVAACDETENAEFEEYRKIVTAMAQKVNEDWGTSQNIKSGKLYRQHPAEEIDAIVEQCTEKTPSDNSLFFKDTFDQSIYIPVVVGEIVAQDFGGTSFYNVGITIADLNEHVMTVSDGTKKTSYAYRHDPDNPQDDNFVVIEIDFTDAENFQFVALRFDDQLQHCVYFYGDSHKNFVTVCNDLRNGHENNNYVAYTKGNASYMITDVKTVRNCFETVAEQYTETVKQSAKDVLKNVSYTVTYQQFLEHMGNYVEISTTAGDWMMNGNIVIGYQGTSSVITLPDDATKIWCNFYISDSVKTLIIPENIKSVAATTDYVEALQNGQEPPDADYTADLSQIVNCPAKYLRILGGYNLTDVQSSADLFVADNHCLYADTGELLYVTENDNITSLTIDENNLGLDVETQLATINLPNLKNLDITLSDDGEKSGFALTSLTSQSIVLSQKRFFENITIRNVSGEFVVQFDAESVSNVQTLRLVAKENASPDLRLDFYSPVDEVLLSDGFNNVSVYIYSDNTTEITVPQDINLIEVASSSQLATVYLPWTKFQFVYEGIKNKLGIIETSVFDFDYQTTTENLNIYGPNCNAVFQPTTQEEMQQLELIAIFPDIYYDDATTPPSAGINGYFGEGSGITVPEKILGYTVTSYTLTNTSTQSTAPDPVVEGITELYLPSTLETFSVVMTENLPSYSLQRIVFDGSKERFLEIFGGDMYILETLFFYTEEIQCTDGNYLPEIQNQIEVWNYSDSSGNTLSIIVNWGSSDTWIADLSAEVRLVIEGELFQYHGFDLNWQHMSFTCYPSWYWELPDEEINQNHKFYHVSFNLTQNTRNGKNEINSVSVDWFDFQFVSKEASEDIFHHFDAVKTVQPTCTSWGNSYTVCSVCGEWGENLEETPPIGHDFQNHVFVPSTCTEYGYWMKTCTACGETETYDYETSLAPHSYTILVEEKESTCIEQGYQRWQCDLCGDVRKNNLPLSDQHLYGDDGLCTVCNEAHAVFDLFGTDEGYVIVGLHDDTTTEITVPSQLRGIPVYRFTFTDNTSLQKVVVAEGTGIIGENAFAGCTALREVILPDSVYTITGNAFAGCTSLTGIVLPDSLNNVESTSFKGCTSLTSIEMKENTSLGTMHVNYVFADCPLQTATINGRDFAYMYFETLVSLTVIGGELTGSSEAIFAPNLQYLEICDNATGGISPVFQNSAKLTTVIVGDGVQYIYDDAFANCTSLTDVTLGRGIVQLGRLTFTENVSVHISDFDAFCLTAETFTEWPTNCNIYADGNLLTEFVSPETMQTVPANMFKNYGKLEKIVLTNVVTIGENAFENCTNLATADMGDCLQGIESFAFQNCGLKEIVIPDSVVSVDCQAFYMCQQATKLHLGKKLTTFGDYSFASLDSLKEITSTPDAEFVYAETGSRYIFSDTNGVTSADVSSEISILFDKSEIETININSGTGKSFSLRGNTKVTSVTMADSVTTISQNAFSGCTALSQIQLSPNITVIGRYAFSDCTALSQIQLSPNITVIGSYAFRNCTLLQTIEIPSTVTEIGAYAFSGCTAINSMTVPEGVTTIEKGTFENCTALREIELPDSVDTIGVSAFSHTALSQITLPQTLLSIAATAFSDCTQLTDVTLPDSLRTLGEYCFKGCTSLEGTINLPSIVTIEDGAFQDTKISEVVLGQNLESVGYFAFKTVENNLNKVNFLGSVAQWTQIDFEMNHCNPTYYANDLYINGVLLTEIDLQTDVSEIKQYVFYNCKSLTDVYLGSNIVSLQQEIFVGCDGLTTLTIPFLGATAEANGNLMYLFGDYVSGLKEVTLLQGTEIADEAFRNWDSLEKVVLPSSLQSLGEKAFQACSSLRSLTYTGSTEDVALPPILMRIGRYAFGGTTLLYEQFDNGYYVDDWLVDYAYGASSVTIRDRTHGIAEYALANLPCTELTIPKYVGIIGFSALNGCSQLESLTVPFVGGFGVARTQEEKNAAYFGYIFGSSDKYNNNECVPATLTRVEITSTREIQYSGMSGLSNLTQLVLHDGLRYVYSLAFIDCRSLQQLWIDDVASWCEIDFEEMYANPMMYADELYIAGERLYGQLEIPETVTEIKAYAFYGYEGRYATLPRSLQKVGRMAFSFTSLEKIYYYGSIDQWQLVDLDPTALGEGTQVPVYYYSAYQPTEEGNFWYKAPDGQFIEW